MKKSYFPALFILLGTLTLRRFYFYPILWEKSAAESVTLSNDSTFLPKINKAVDYRATTNEGRQEYLFNLLKDPVSQEIPRGIRTKELNFGQELANELATKAKSDK